MKRNNETNNCVGYNEVKVFNDVIEYQEWKLQEVKQTKLWSKLFTLIPQIFEEK